MSRPASIYPAVLVEDVVPPSLKADVLAMVMGAAWAVAIDGRLRATVTAGRETVSARKTEAERSLCAGVCSGGVERSCSRRIAKGWRPPSPSQSPIICGLVDEDGVKDGCSTPGDRRWRANMGAGTKFTGGGNMTLFEPGRPILGPIAMSAKTRFLFQHDSWFRRQGRILTDLTIFIFIGAK
ncbi:uncharacterized protein LOC119319519 isoform X1 [Triticum dicoccoides]|uniref:uncharacterized protein LOC119319519 isoform X1 n=1 Tax=Triticum dicoccoides TaxID=85692 RepID=UPI001891DB99|nr:uncharacterized protein LOC119319519 isoform X1 [Triticum dicoccoides]